MNIFIVFYFGFGIGFYMALAIVRKNTFHHTGPDSIIRGAILGVVFWPIAILISPLWRGNKND